jgi:hypothetical protein
MNPTAVMSDSREKFEEWARKEAPWLDLRWIESPDHPMYAFTEARVAFDAWNASRTAAMGEAAKICEKLRDSHCAGTRSDDNPGDWCAEDGIECDFVCAWNDAATAIRIAGEGSKG